MIVPPLTSTASSIYRLNRNPGILRLTTPIKDVLVVICAESDNADLLNGPLPSPLVGDLEISLYIP